MSLSPIMSGLLVFVHIIVVTYSKQIFKLLRKAHDGKVPLKDKLLLFIGDLFSTIVVLLIPLQMQKVTLRFLQTFYQYQLVSSLF